MGPADAGESDPGPAFMSSGADPQWMNPVALHVVTEDWGLQARSMAVI